MTRLQYTGMAARLLRSSEGNLLFAQQPLALSSSPAFRMQQRNASTTDKSKPIVLEQPDKFRPPSHPSKLISRRGRGSTLDGAYNQSSTSSEQEAQKKRRYPHMFPPPGSTMYRFLTDKTVHILIVFTVLVICGGLSYLQTFMTTSPWANLVPPISSLFRHPIRYFQDWWMITKMHKEYSDYKGNVIMARNALDVQYRRLYRRAHGMEDLNAFESQGVDVRGLVPWDDGLTNRERAAGGIGANRISMASMMITTDDNKAEYDASNAKYEAWRNKAEEEWHMFVRRKGAELGIPPEEDPALKALDTKKLFDEHIGPAIPLKIEIRQSLSLREEQRRWDGTVQRELDEAALKEMQAKEEKKKKKWLGIW